MEYTVDISCLTKTPEARAQMEKNLNDFSSKELNIAKKDIANEGSELILDISWSGKGQQFKLIRDRLLTLAEKYEVCFEVQLHNENESSDIIFIGVGALNKEADKIVNDLYSLLPRLTRRSAIVSQKMNMKEEELLHVLKKLEKRQQ